MSLEFQALVLEYTETNKFFFANIWKGRIGIILSARSNLMDNLKTYVLSTLIQDGHLCTSKQELKFKGDLPDPFRDCLKLSLYDLIRGLYFHNLVCLDNDFLSTVTIKDVATLCNQSETEVKDRNGALITPVIFNTSENSCKGLKKDSRVLLIKSITKTCNNTYNLIARLELSNIKVVGIISLLDFDSYGGALRLLREGYYFNSLIEEKDLLGKHKHNVHPFITPNIISETESYLFAHTEIDD